ncbi:MAG TPA: hypothetical protein VND64_28470 [Pirellulales bacterium]|nr:hypothetical protein [Pirellulales bacterium]
MRIRIPQFYVVNYASVGDAIRTGWFSHRVPGADRAYFGFSDRALAERFGATATLGGFGPVSVDRGRWLPTFLDYPDLRRQLETGLANPGTSVKLLALDPPSFDVPVVYVAPTAAVIEALSSNPDVESGIEVDFQSCSNLPSQTKPDPIESLRRLPPGSACLIDSHKPPAPPRAAWVLRRTDAQIAELERHGECQIWQRATAWNYTFAASGVEVRLVAAAIAVGLEPFAPENISVAFINQHDPGCRNILEYLAAQDITPIALVGDSDEAGFSLPVKNTLREFAQTVLPRISSVPPWTRSDFAHCVSLFRERFPNKLALWNHLARGVRPRLTEGST